MIFQDPCHLIFENWSIYRNCNTFSSFSCLLFIDLVLYHIILLILCLQNLASWSTWQICKQTLFLFCVCRSIEFTSLWTHKALITHHFSCLYPWIYLGWVVFPNRYIIILYKHRKCSWFWWEKISYLTFRDCLDLWIFYADNSTMHMDQIQWK